MTNLLITNSPLSNVLSSFTSVSSSDLLLEKLYDLSDYELALCYREVWYNIQMLGMIDDPLMNELDTLIPDVICSRFCFTQNVHTDGFSGSSFLCSLLHEN